MKIVLGPAAAQTRGSILLLVFVFLTISLMVLVAALGWTTTNTSLTGRHNQYFRSIAGAEAATEKVLARISRDYQNGGETMIFANLDAYRFLVPTVSESSAWSSYEFKDNQGVVGRTQVDFVPPSEYRVLSSQYRGLRGYASAFRVTANARETDGRYNIAAGVRQDVEVATIPVFQFAIFYNVDLEICPGPPMNVTGLVHCNTNIFTQPQSPLTFQSDVTAGGSIVPNKKPGDPLIRTPAAVVFEAEHDGGVSTLSLPIGTNNSPAAVREIVEIPPTGESASSAMGKERFYNKADLVIVVSDSGIVANSGLVNNFSTTIPSSQLNVFVDTAVTFFNKRENKTVHAVQIDVAKLLQWNATNTLLRSLLPTSDIRTIYVADTRTQNSSTESGIRLVNGQTLLPKGFTVATPNPLYIKGNYNAPSSSLGTTNTSATVPASVVADAVTILSTAWNDANSTSGLYSRLAGDTTVNAAFLAGIVPTTTASYSGGVENFPRFLEDWSDGRVFTYNGSMVVMYESKFATGLWRDTGGAVGIYNPPNRNWAFDQNFRDPNKIPPGCPAVRVLIRGAWTMVKPGSGS